MFGTYLTYALGTDTPAPAPTPKAPGKAADATPAESSKGLLPALGDWISSHPLSIPIILIGLYIAAQYGWRQYTIKQNQRGKAVRPLNAIIRDTIRFARKDDNRPLHPKLPPAITGTRLYLVLLALTIAGMFTGLPAIPFFLILAIALYARAGKIFKQRRGIVGQMFAVAHGDIRYPKGSELAPWNYVQVQSWTNLTQPGTTMITIPAAFQSEDLKTREKFERNFNGTVSEENAWTYTWESAKNRLVCTPAGFLPTMASYPGPGPKWDEFVLGSSGDDEQAIWNVSQFPHSLICGPTGSGKALALTERVPTPDGWSTIGEIREGDVVFDSNGNPCNVVGLSPIFTDHKTYEVVFSDGSVIVADADHLWWTETRAVRESRWTEKRKPRLRRQLLPAETVERLQEALDGAGLDSEITLREVASLAGVAESSGWLRDIAAEIGPIGEIKPVIQFHYGAQVIESRQWVRRWDAGAVFSRLAHDKRRSDWSWEGYRATFKALAKNKAGERLTATEVAGLLAVTRRKAMGLLDASGVTATKQRELVKQVHAAKTVERTGNWVRTYSMQRFLARVIEYGQKAAWDQRHRQARGAVRTTEEILQTLRTSHGHANHSVPVAHALMLPEAHLPVAPYTLGVWLGDGTSWHGSFVGIDHEIARNVEAEGYTLTESRDGRGTDTHPDFRKWTVLGLKRTLKDLGILKTSTADGHTKRIPIEYLRASRAQRQTLLAGLLDTDGTVGGSGSVQITQVNERLARDIHELAISLGYRATIGEGRAALDGKDAGPAWTVSWTCSPEQSPFRIIRKINAHAERSRFHKERNDYRYIVDVREVETVPTRCIMVDSADRLFLAGEAMIPTHNSVLQRMILFHALAHSDTWRIVGVDPKMVEMGWLKKYPSVLKIALTLEEGVEVTRSVRDEMRRRYEEMSDPAVGVNHFLNLPDRPPAILLMIDETFNFLAPEGVKSDEGKERDAMHMEASALLGEIARLGRAAGIHLACATQRPDATVIKGEMKNNLDCRIAAGRLDTTPSLMVLDSEAATRLPKIKGRGMIRQGGDIKTFQGYFAEQSWYDEWLAQQQPGAREADGPDVEQAEATPAETPADEAAPKKGRGMMKRLAEKAAARSAEIDSPAGDITDAPEVSGPEIAAVADGAVDSGSLDEVMEVDPDEGLDDFEPPADPRGDEPEPPYEAVTAQPITAASPAPTSLAGVAPAAEVAPAPPVKPARGLPDYFSPAAPVADDVADVGALESPAEPPRPQQVPVVAPSGIPVSRPPGLPVRRPPTAPPA